MTYASYDPALGTPGDFFFHYMTREAAFEHILPERRLRLSPAFRMRDPLESNPAVVFAAYGQTTDDSQVEYDRQVASMQATIELQRVRRCSKVLSLTIDAAGYVDDAEIFGCGYARARLWEHYAENHRGVCLMLRRTAFHSAALEQLKSRSCDSWAGEVRYTQRGILDDPAARVMLADPSMTGVVGVEAHVRENATSLFFTKLMDWQSEHEYRFVEASTNDDYTFVDIGDTLAGVIVGHEFPDWQSPGLFAWCDRVGAQPWRMSWDRGLPSLQQISPRD